MSGATHVNEWGHPVKQSPSWDVWFISRFERLNEWANQANWQSTAATTNDYLANTLSKKGTVYSPNGSWWVFQYYANMTGDCLATTASADGGFDVFAVSSGTGVGSTKVITGSHGTTNPYLLKTANLTSKGYKSSGTISVSVREFSWTGLYNSASKPGIAGTFQVNIVDDSVSPIQVPWLVLSASFGKPAEKCANRFFRSASVRLPVVKP